MNPYLIDGPAVISFSGGRTSAYMLFKIIEAHGGTLPDNVVVCFANTGKEMSETLDFVEQCSIAWNVKIIWLEYDGKKSYRTVKYHNASRNGEPFDQLTTDKKYLPNMIARFCTQELKVLTINRYLADIGFDKFDTAVGIRADEPRRVTKMRAKENYLVPLADKKITKADIFKFWNAQSFDLKMPNRGGVNDFGNCDLCFLKGGSLKLSIIEQFPDKANWWIAQEKKIGASFRSDQPSYEQMQIIASDQGAFDFDDETISCFCGD